MTEQDFTLEEEFETYDPDDFDPAAYEELTEDGEAEPAVLPIVAVVGRPNVGKSTLVNRIIGRREAVVEDVPGVTRDRVSYKANWNGREFTVVDTGGWLPDSRGLAAAIAEQAKLAVELADVVLFVVDANVGATDIDEAVVEILRRAKKPVVLAANKADDTRTELEATALWSLGVGEPMPVSALHGRSSGDLLDRVLESLPEPAPRERLGEAVGGPRRVALMGRPNVGKSSLLNKLAKQNRVVVDSVAGTTRDPIDELIDLGGKTWRFIDTAGIRKRHRENQGADFYAILRTQSALERSEVAVVLVDASEPLAEQDLRIVNTIVEAGRALVLAYNKWDLVDEERRFYLDREIERQLVGARWAPRVNISAKTGRHMEKLVPAIETALDSWGHRVPTGKLNQFFTDLVSSHPHPIRGGKQPRVLFATQAGTRPPRFVLFTSGFLEPGYRRFIERRIREEFGFEGSPVTVTMKIREKKKDRDKRFGRKR
ncbi:GTP-binding protein [Actinocorallia herbida]|uniref:GTPase Der n=1 Tax=Actinocorallia herbida TaxID=58109 RepID=A0A3N1CRY1_9ACTN|nr:ribosome biogenesis GTPase Der [Actinocorallia herbida]ROO84063.1 GTP-binding protein [Actinocorallia herbida]